jgi:hypothetical protein
MIAIRFISDHDLGVGSRSEKNLDHDRDPIANSTLDKSCHYCVSNDLFVMKKRGSRANHRNRQITNEPVIHADAFFMGA